jgi:hypothetical protein
MLTLIYRANHPPVYASLNREADFRRAGKAMRRRSWPVDPRTEGRLTFANAANAGEKMQHWSSKRSRVIALE